MKEIKVKRLTDKDFKPYRITLSLKIGDLVFDYETGTMWEVVE